MLVLLSPSSTFLFLSPKSSSSVSQGFLCENSHSIYERNYFALCITAYEKYLQVYGNCGMLLLANLFAYEPSNNTAIKLLKANRRLCVNMGGSM